jgi:DNA primase
MGRKKDEDELSLEELDSDLKDALKEDREFKKFKLIVKHIEETYDLDALAKEVRNLHEGRPSRALPKVPSADAVLEAQIKDGQSRSRMGRILADLINQEGILEDAFRAIRAHLGTTYAEMLPSLKTKLERQEYMNKYLRRGVKLHHRVKTLQKVVAVYMEDIDKMGYAFSGTIKILEMLYARNAKH